MSNNPIIIGGQPLPPVLTEFNGSNQLVKLDASGALPAISGANLINVGTDTVSTYTLAYGTGQNLDVSIDKFSIITLTNGDAFVNLPATLNNSGKVMKIRSDSSSIGRLYINGSEKGTNKYFILGGDTAIFECDNTSWKLISGPNYIVPYFGKLKQNSARGCVFAYGNKLYGLGRGHENQAEAISGAYSNVYTPTLLQLYNSDGVSYYDTSTISGFADILIAENFAMALTNEGIVFQWGTDYAGINGAVRSPRKINFPNNELIESIYMAGSGSNSFFESIAASAFYAISTTGKVYSWGYQEVLWKNLGHNDSTIRYTPTLITAIQDKRIVKLAVGGNYGIYCACIDNTGQLYTWGWNGNPVANGNPLGNNVATIDTPVGVPTAIAGFTDVVDVVAIGAYCNVINAFFRGYIRILRADGSTWASGYNGAGNLGITGTTSYRVFTRESTNRTDIAKLGTSCSVYTHPVSVIITKEPDCKVYFAGVNEKGWMGRGDTANVNTFVLNATQLSAGFQGNMFDNRGINCQAGAYGSINAGWPQGIVLDGNGKIWTCGDNSIGTCGDGTRTDRNTWFQVKFPTNRRVIDFQMVGWYESVDRGIIVIFEDGTMMSWGQNQNGALGNNVYSNTISYPIPRYVIGFDPETKNT